MDRLWAVHPLPRLNAIAAIIVTVAGCGAQTTDTGESVDQHPRGPRDASVATGSGGAPEAGVSNPSGSGGAPEAPGSEGSGGVFFHIDASPRSATGGASGPPQPLDDAALARCREISDSARRDLTAAIALSCKDDSECTLFYAGPPCVVNCGLAGRADSEAALEKAIAAANHKWCEDYSAQGCPLAIAECIQARAACRSGKCELVGGPLYRFDITNPIDSGETIAATRFDISTGDCVVAEFFVTAGPAPVRFLRAALIPDARTCCPLAASAQLGTCDASTAPACAWTAAAPDPAGTASIGPQYTLNADYTFSFPAISREVEFRTMGLARSSCLAP